MRKILAVLATVMLLAAACGDDSSVDDALDDAIGEDESDATTDDTSDGDTADEDMADGDMSDHDMDDESVPDDDGDSGDAGPSVSGDFDCTEIEEAMDAAGQLQGDPTGMSGEGTEAEFERSRQTLETLGDEVPELREDVDQALAGMDKMGEALASIGWDTEGLATDPQAVREFVSLISDTDVLAMVDAFTNISTWIAEECAA